MPGNYRQSFIFPKGTGHPDVIGYPIGDEFVTWTKGGRRPWFLSTAGGFNLLPTGIALPPELFPWQLKTRAQVENFAAQIVDLAPWGQISPQNIRQHISRESWIQVKKAATVALRECWADRRGRVD